MNKINPVILAAERGGVVALKGPDPKSVTHWACLSRVSRGCVRSTLRSQDHQNPAGSPPHPSTGGTREDGSTALSPRRPGRTTPLPHSGAPAPYGPVVTATSVLVGAGAIPARLTTLPASQASATRSVAPRGCGGVESRRHAHESRNRPVSQRGQRSRGRRLLGSCLRTGVNEVASRGNLRRISARPSASRPIQFPRRGDAERCRSAKAYASLASDKTVQEVIDRWDCRFEPQGSKAVVFSSGPSGRACRERVASPPVLREELLPALKVPAATLRTSFLPTGSPVNSGGLPSRRLAGFVGRG